MNKTFWWYLKYEKFNIPMVFLATMVITIILGYYTYCFMDIYDHLHDKSKSDFTITILRMLFMVCLYIVLTVIKQIMLSGLKHNLLVKIQKDLLTELISYRYEYFIRKNTGKIIKRVIEDCGGIADGLVKVCVGISEIIVIAGWLVFFFIFIRNVLFVFLFVILIFISWAFIWRKAIEKSAHDIGKEYTAMYRLFWDIIPGIKTIKLELLDQQVINEIDLNMKNLHKARFRNTMFNNCLWNINLFLPWITFIMIIMFAFRDIDAGLFSVTLLIVSLMFIWRLIEPLNELSSILISFQEYKSAKQRINDYRDGIAECGGEESFPTVLRDIRFEKVSFTYAERAFHLSDISLKIMKGENIGIMGKTGAGKSTIAHLLLRLYDPVSGQITINDKRIDSYSLDSLRRNIVLVPQEPRLYSVSLRSNIDPKSMLKDEDIIRLLAKVKLEYLLTKLPAGLDTNIMKEGLDLSGGEKQRIGIARALGLSAPVYVFDEITSGLDSETSDHVINTIYDPENNATTVTISHNPDILPYMDRIFIINNDREITLDNKERLLTASDILRYL